MRRYMIVGWGAAGMAAIEAIRARDARSPLIVFSDERHPFYSRPGLAYLLTGAIPASQLFPRSKRDFESLRVEFQHIQVVDILPEEQKVILEGGREEPYDRLLLALGASAVRPKLAGIELSGVVTLDTLDDALTILKSARRARRAVVIGGGITALELAEGLAAQGVETHYLLRGERYWRGVLDETESKMVETGMEEEGVRIHHNSEVARIDGRKGRVIGVDLVDGRYLKCDLVALAIGIRPRLALPKRAGLSTDRGVLVDEQMRTSVSNIFAAGDVAQVFDPVSGEYVLDSLWWVARQQGAIAGANMAGDEEKYRKPTAFNVTRVGGKNVTIIGALGRQDAASDDPDMVAIARGDSETWRRDGDAFAVEGQSGESRLRVMVGKKYLMGALVMGDQTLSKPLQDLISSRADIRTIRTRLLEEEQQMEELLLHFWEEWRRSDAVV